MMSSSLTCSRKAAALLATTFLGAAFGSSAIAQEYEDPNYYGNGYKPETNQTFFAGSQQTAEVQLWRSELAQKAKDWDGAIALLRQSLESNDDDIDAHKFLAVCLEEKLKQQKVDDRDPEMFHECVNEWLIVLRNLKGPEKGLTLKNGRSIGVGASGRYDDEMGAILARTHLQKLCGSVPKRNETNDHYLARVTKPAETDVSGKIMKLSGKQTARPE